MKKENRLLTIDGETLMSQPLTPLNFVVDTLLSQGLHILAGSPKVGKSWLALWLAVTVAKGEAVWGMGVKQGTTLYLCLEDSTATVAELWKINSTYNTVTAVHNHFLWFISLCFVIRFLTLRFRFHQSPGSQHEEPHHPAPVPSVHVLLQMAQMRFPALPELPFFLPAPWRTFQNL